MAAGGAAERHAGRSSALLEFLRRLDGLNFPPGSEISYSNTGYRLVQAALGAKGIDYGAALQEWLLRPLGLGIRLAYDETEPVPGLAGGYWRSPAGWRRGRYGVHISASGGLAGSARDLVAWLQALMAGRPPLAGVLPALSAVRSLADGRPTAYGLGLERQHARRAGAVRACRVAAGVQEPFPARSRGGCRRGGAEQPRGHRAGGHRARRDGGAARRLRCPRPRAACCRRGCSRCRARRSGWRMPMAW